MSAKPLKWITPIFQQLLNKQVGKIMDAIDEDKLLEAFVASHTLVGALNPSDRDRLLREYILPIKKQLERAGNGRLDFYVAGVGASNQQREILRRNIRPIYTAIMNTLHEGRYLEIRQQYVVGHELGTNP